MLAERWGHHTQQRSPAETQLVKWLVMQPFSYRCDVMLLNYFRKLIGWDLRVQFFKSDVESYFLYDKAAFRLPHNGCNII